LLELGHILLSKNSGDPNGVV
jgi:hypothetical protein